MHALLPGMPRDANEYWVRTTSHDHGLIDRTTTRIEDTLTNHGYDVGSEIKYVARANEVASFAALTRAIALIGFLVVAISMAGLANTLTMSVIERTREIGILRSIGARARDIRRIFTAEAPVLALVGWLLAIPVGYLLDRFFVWLANTIVNIEIPASFALWHLVVALVGTTLLALLTTHVPIQRAVRYRPGAALRYA